ncbi:MAG TPA: DNA replication and repair protein RecF [Thermoanaerobaculia bacterium]|nr:DNA replication and repair protein RecF [Thermoanaerobaculia bacterium]
MLVTLETRSFRNLADQAIRFAPGRQLLVGRNGAGKTSLLEAVYLLATTRSFRTAQLADCARHGSDGFHLAADAGPEGRQRLEVGWQPSERRRRLNGHEVPLTRYLAALRVVAWTSAEAGLLAGPPELGRRLLDRGVIGLRPGAIEALRGYRRALAQKRELLAAGGHRGIDSWNAVLAAAAAEVIARRADYAERLQQAYDAVHARTPLDLPPLRLAYVPSPRRGREGEAAIAAALAHVARREGERRMPLVGPHRDRLVFLWQGREIQRVASAGERKALGMLLLAAQGRVLQEASLEPLLLLDDADAELDRRRQGAVWEAFRGVGQLLATSSREEAWEGVPVEGRRGLEDGVVGAPEATSEGG